MLYVAYPMLHMLIDIYNVTCQIHQVLPVTDIKCFWQHISNADMSHMSNAPGHMSKATCYTCQILPAMWNTTWHISQMQPVIYVKSIMCIQMLSVLNVKLTYKWTCLMCQRLLGIHMCIHQMLSVLNVKLTYNWTCLMCQKLMGTFFKCWHVIYAKFSWSQVKSCLLDWSNITCHVKYHLAH